MAIGAVYLVRHFTGQEALVALDLNTIDLTLTLTLTLILIALLLN